MQIQSFFWFCSGATIPILKKSPSDHIKYAGIGATVFFTGLFAALSAGYALYYVFNDSESIVRISASVGFGLLWGLMIFNLDRYIVSGMKKKNGIWSEARMAFPRLILATVIAVVISRPLELQIFHTSIETELIAMKELETQRQEQLVQNRFIPAIRKLEDDIQLLQSEISTKTERRNQLEESARNEADGTGGTQKRGAKTIYKLKRQDADKAQAELDTFLRKRLPQLLTLQEDLRWKRTEADSVKSAIPQLAFDGFDKRLDALGQVTDRSQSMAMASWFLMLLFVVVEILPVLVKLLSPRGPYDDLLEKHEHAVEIYKIEEMSSLNQKANNRILNMKHSGMERNSGLDL